VRIYWLLPYMDEKAVCFCRGTQYVLMMQPSSINRAFFALANPKRYLNVVLRFYPNMSPTLSFTMICFRLWIHLFIVAKICVSTFMLTCMFFQFGQYSFHLLFLHFVLYQFICGYPVLGLNRMYSECTV
jgi:hypothetical protein